MARHTTTFSLLVLTLSVSIPHSTGRRQCAEVIDDPRSVFNQSNVYTEPLAAYIATDLVDCMGICCYDEISCNVGVYMESSPSDINCWLYFCYTLDSCAVEIRKRSVVFVNYNHPTDNDNIQTSQNPGYPTPVYQDSNVDYANTKWNTDNTPTYNKNETDENASNSFASLEGNTVSTPPSMTAEVASVTEPELISETTHKNTLLSLASQSIFQYDTFIMPGNEVVLKNDTFTTTLNETGWENGPIFANISKEIEGNITSESLFTNENDTGHENDNATVSVKDEHDIESVTFWAADQLTSINSSFSLSTSEVVLAQIPGTKDQHFYSSQQTLHSEDSAIHPTDTTSYSDLLAAMTIFSSGDWSTTFVVSATSHFESTIHLSEQGGESLVMLESVMTVNSSGYVSSTRNMAEEDVTNLLESTETSPVPQQSASMTSDIFPPSDLQSQHSPNGTESRADINYQPSEATTGLLISALTVGCVCALAVVVVLSLRIYDGYKKRHYSRLDYLINGIYN
ncbi:unnamed protein product [Candidula unifasciata]|uniref:MANSC domain-containing protein n=1 Tax=Candidula unifasciata TaxID=100452 RepID=A0A8S3ZUD7_9EUPU|nr:unnamed protein product [Candidula unifasciata]